MKRKRSSVAQIVAALKHALLQLPHGRERWGYGDSAYASQKALIRGKAPRGARLHEAAHVPQRRRQ